MSSTKSEWCSGGPLIVAPTFAYAKSFATTSGAVSVVSVTADLEFAVNDASRVSSDAKNTTVRYDAV